MRLLDRGLDAEDRAALGQQNELLLKDYPHLHNIDRGDIDRLARFTTLSREVKDLATASLAERASGYFAWREAEKPGDRELRESAQALWGSTPREFKRRYEALVKEDPKLAVRLRADWNKALSRSADAVR